MAKQVKETTEKVAPNFISGTGRRKTAVAKVFLYEGKGEFIVNGMDIQAYFPSEVDQTKWVKPFHLIGVSHPKARFSCSIKVFGSGKSAQIGAVVHGISRALSSISDEYRKVLSKQGMLTRDSRMVERKKPFLHKARKAPQYSKR
jgi:small subunit ribosomal protein S9